MKVFTATNGILFTITEDGVLRWEGGYDPRRVTDALREYFQRERDTQLGRWRDPQNPDIVCYPVVGDLDAVWVVYEGDGSRYHATRTDWERIRPHYVSETARRYFAAHPDEEPHKPWHDAKVGEYWLVTLEGAGPIPTTVGNYDENLYFTVGDDDYYCPTNDHRIQNAVRLTPEGSSDE